MPQRPALAADAAAVRRSITPLGVSALLHAALAAALVLVPLLAADALPVRGAHGFFAEPLSVAPPPPPPPALGGRGQATRRVAGPAPAQGFFAPVAIPSLIEADAFDLGPAGDPNGVEGGVPDGVVGSIIGDLPAVAPPPPPRVVRVSSYAAPRLVRKVAPAYPELARHTNATGTVVLEAQVDTRGHVVSVRTLSGHPLLEPAAVEAVRQWRYQPLLLGGEPTAFLVTVSVTFTLAARQAHAG
jgi:protein TonB